MNLPLILSLIILAILLGVFVYYASDNIKQVDENKGVYTLPILNNLCYPDGKIQNLPEVSNQCCVVYDIKTTRQIIPIDAPVNIYNLLIDTTPLPATQVCYDLCQKKDTTTGTCLDTSGQYINCVNNLKAPEGCFDMTIPVAHFNDTPYYAVGIYVPGKNGTCQDRVTC